jgi:fibrillarin-like rRNA methylase
VSQSRSEVKQIKVNGIREYATPNLVRGLTVYGEKLVKLDDEEYRIWDPFRSKLAAAMRKGLRDFPLNYGDKVLYLGASTGTTVSHVSDLIGNKGLVFAVEPAVRVARELIENVASKMPGDLNPISRFLEMLILFIAILRSQTKQKSPSRIAIPFLKMEAFY